jgi:4-oxalocrotonate tautomerase
MPIVRLSLWKGRTAEQKAQIAKALTEALVRSAGCPAEAVIVMIEEEPKENWATAGEPHSVRFPDP